MVTPEEALIGGTLGQEGEVEDAQLECGHVPYPAVVRVQQGVHQQRADLFLQNSHSVKTNNIMSTMYHTFPL